MKITYIHHSSFLVETEAAYLLFDYFQGKLPEISQEKPLQAEMSEESSVGIPKSERETVVNRWNFLWAGT